MFHPSQTGVIFIVSLKSRNLLFHNLQSCTLCHVVSQICTFPALYFCFGIFFEMWSGLKRNYCSLSDDTHDGVPHQLRIVFLKSSSLTLSPNNQQRFYRNMIIPFSIMVPSHLPSELILSTLLKSCAPFAHLMTSKIVSRLPPFRQPRTHCRLATMVQTSAAKFL